nr:hypothetical protein [Nostoc sp. ZfuVER08]
MPAFKLTSANVDDLRYGNALMAFIIPHLAVCPA